MSSKNNNRTQQGMNTMAKGKKSKKGKKEGEAKEQKQ
jgi:hypothetical protein